MHNRPEELVLEVTAYADAGSWVRLDAGMVLHGCQTGKTYHLQRTEGFVLNEQVIMPDSACHSFTLYFDPLDARDQAVHWLETPQDTLFSGMAVRNLPRPEGTFACRLQGRIQSDQTCRRLLVLDALGNYGDNCRRSIPVRQQKFDYTFYTAEPQVVQLVKWEEWKDGAWYEHPFFVEEGINTFDLPDSSENLVIHKVTEANREWNTYQNLIRKMERETGVLSLYDEINQLTKEETYSAAALTLYNQLDSVFRVLEEQETAEAIERRYQLFERRNILRRNGEMFSPAYQALSKKVDVLNQSIEEKLYARIEQTPSWAGLYYLKGRIESYVQRRLIAYQRPYAIYRKKFAARWGQHPLGRYIEAIVASVNQMKVGQLYEDYQADDLQGNA
ncbi:thiol:disulfide interchange protein, partial [gut metagenome]